MRGGWSVRLSGAARALRSGLPKETAVRLARKLASARQVDLYISDANGRIDHLIRASSHQ